MLHDPHLKENTAVHYMKPAPIDACMCDVRFAHTRLDALPNGNKRHASLSGLMLYTLHVKILLAVLQYSAEHNVHCTFQPIPPSGHNHGNRIIYCRDREIKIIDNRLFFVVFNYLSGLRCVWLFHCFHINYSEIWRICKHNLF